MLAGITDDIRGLIGRCVDFYVPTYSGCSVCSLDQYHNTSTDPFCPTCSGVYWIPSYTITSVSGHITWKPAEILNWQSGGQLFDGDCRVQIKLQDGTEDMLDNTEYVVVDNRKMEIRSRILRGVPTPYRVLVDLDEIEKES